MAGSVSELSRERCQRAEAVRWVLWCAVVGTALLALIYCGAFAHVVGVRPVPMALGLAIAGFAIGQFARIPARVGPDLVMLAWGEVGLVTALCLVPIVWVPIVVAIGAVLGHGHRFIGADRTWRIRITYALATVSTAAGVATWGVGTVSTRLNLVDASTGVVRAELERPLTLLPLVLGALLYFAVTSVLTAAWVAHGTPSGVGETWQRLASAKRLMFSGNVAAGIAVAVAIAVDPRWLLALVPVLWALHRAYAFRLRSGAQWTDWAALADATRDLNQLDQEAVARSALRGAAELFAPDDVELVLELPLGRRRYVAAGAPAGRRSVLSATEAESLNALAGPDAARSPGPVDSNVLGGPLSGRLSGRLSSGRLFSGRLFSGRLFSGRLFSGRRWGAAAREQVAVRQLDVGGQHLGELRLTFGRPAGLADRGSRGVAGLGSSGSGLTGAEQHAFSTFADAVASALHDAATARHLQAMTALSAFEAVHDPLTGLSTRSTLLALGNGHLGRAVPGPAVALIMFDLNGFRAVNDTLGYAAGDELLRVLGRRLADRCGSEEILGRPGADEFALLLTNPTARRAAVRPRPSADAAGPAAGLSWPGTEISGTPDGGTAGTAATPERGWAYPLDRARDLLAALAAPVEVRGVTLAIEASAGIVLSAGGESDMSELLRRAESALHQAKREHTRIARYDPVHDRAANDRLTLLAEFRDALAATDQLVLEVQPTVDLLTGVPVSAEALVRWDHPRRGRLLPHDFVGTLEGTEGSAALTSRVLELAVAVAAGWAEQGLRVPISVNLCRRCIADPALPTRLVELLGAHGLPADQLILEITESVTADAAAARPVMAQLRAIGVQVSVDDFGTGSASLSFLTSFVVDEVKIDRAFVSSMVDSPETAAIVKAAVDLAHRLGLRVVAEGVETEQQLAALLDLGVRTGQGFLLHPPLPVPATTAVLQDLRRTQPV